LDVLEATLGPAARTVALDHGRVVRTSTRPDHAPGNALHLDDPVAPAALTAAVDELARRFPTGRARLVAPLPAGLPLHQVRVPGFATSRMLVLERTAGAVVQVRRDLEIGPPTDDRAWHGLTVLQRHAAPPGEVRDRGQHDDRLRWWVDGLRELVGQGRARVLRVARFGTPVAAGVLHWSPGTPVGDGRAGLAVVADVVVHPAHRRLGIGRALTERLVAVHRADFPRAAVAGVWELPVAGGPPPAPDGWTARGTLAVLTRADDGTDGVRR
jgi:GNAT superfamily N-acetyltransferase